MLQILWNHLMPKRVKEKLKRTDTITVHDFFDNQFHMEFNQEDYEMPKTMTNKAIIRHFQKKYEHYNCTIISYIERNGKRIYG